MMCIMQYRIINTFTGPFAIIQDEDGTLRTTWVTSDVQRQLGRGTLYSRLLPDLASRIGRYFEGEIVDFADVELPSGGDFHRRCWEVCREIPRGDVICYQELAHRAGSPHASRAAGQAMRRNPLPVIIPCHRVIGSNGKLHGFGGSCDARGDALQVKSALLRMEGAMDCSDCLPFSQKRSRLALAV
jgi:methylated-DNA-[protein]-cysteine S-methyltransferase